MKTDAPLSLSTRLEIRGRGQVCFSHFWDKVLGEVDGMIIGLGWGKFSIFGYFEDICICGEVRGKSGFRFSFLFLLS